MATWQQITEKQDLTTNNKGNMYVSTDGVVYEDLNKIVRNLLRQKRIAPHLPGPTVTLQGDFLRVTQDLTGRYTQAYLIYVDGVKVAYVPSAQKQIDLSAIIKDANSHQVFIVCGGAGTIDNDPSNTVTYH